MKLILFFALFSVSAMAQDLIDEQLPTCQREACLVFDDVEYGFYFSQDREGQTYKELNTESSVADLNLSAACYRGDKAEVKEILMALAGNTNRDYTMNGGHILIRNQIFKDKVEEEKIEIFMEEQSDYLPDDITYYSNTINKCN